MLEVAPEERGDGEDRRVNTSPKGAPEEGRTENPSFQGEKRTASEDLEAKASKREKKSSPEGPASGENPDIQSSLTDQPSSEP